MEEEKHEQFQNGVWFEPAEAFIRRKCAKVWTRKHAALARSWVTNGALTQHNMHSGEKLRAALMCVLRYDDLDNVWFTIKNLQKKLREHIPLPRTREVISSSPTFGNKRSFSESESEHSRVAAIEEAEKQHHTRNAQVWRHDGRSGSRRCVSGVRDGAPLRMTSSWEMHEEDDKWWVSLLTEVGHIKVVSPGLRRVECENSRYQTTRLVYMDGKD